MNRLLGRAAGDQIHHSRHRTCAVQGGGDALDHLHLTQIHGRNLQQPQSATLLSEKREAVAQEGGVASAHSLDPHTCRAQGRRRALDPTLDQLRSRTVDDTHDHSTSRLQRDDRGRRKRRPLTKGEVRCVS